MSFQNLISGSECAAPSNPLSQVLKHSDADRSLQQDRLAGPSSSRLHQLPTTAQSAPSNHKDVALARQFFDPNARQGHGLPSFRQDMRLPPVELSDTWITEQRFVKQDHKSSAGWANEFGASAPQLLPQGPQQNAPLQSTNVQHMMYSRPGMYSTMSMGMGMSSMHPGYNESFVTDAGKGKGKSREADFDAAFAQINASLAEQSGTSRIVEVNDGGVTDIDDALQKTSLSSDETDQAAHAPEFSRVWDQLQSSTAPPPQEDLSKWEAEYSQMLNAERDDLSYDYGNAMQDAWESGVGDYHDTSSTKFDETGIPLVGAYVFEPENQYLGPSTSTRSPLNEAKALLEQNGSLSEAALLLEAAIQKGELGEGGYEAWILLGETRNMDEREEAGMRALIEGVKLAEAAGATGVGMLSLAISFTNESFDKASHSMLLRWLRARFPSHPVPGETMKALITHSSWDTHDRVTKIFLDLARSQHSQGVIDPDVQIALGVLFYTNSEYDRAKDCFESALSLRPNDYLLWNRLGSSLSNGNKPEEALGAYREALQLRPTYTRAIYNVGVACLNIGAQKESAEHFLSALALQESTAGETSQQLWFTLRRAFLAMERPDLADLAKPQAAGNLDVFRREGFDF